MDEKPKILFNITVSDKKGRVLRRFSIYAKSAQEARVVFDELNEREIAAGERPLVPSNGSFMVSEGTE